MFLWVLTTCFCDLIAFCLLGKVTLLCSLGLFTIFTRYYDVLPYRYLSLVVFFLLCMGLIMHGRFGLILVSLIPAGLLSRWLHTLLMPHRGIGVYLSFTIALAMEMMLIEPFVLYRRIAPLWLLVMFCGNVIMLTFQLKLAVYNGIQGNRSVNDL